ncbi:MAG: FAD-dependent oxidoreductase [Candidatus Thorarchaeota archaeon]|nr:FAD-dependent oxidoreductase [Candidatus Thorarchaeota archaeon]
MKLVIVGYGPGGVAAAVAAKISAPETEVTILTKETLPAHRRPGVTMAFRSITAGDLTISEWSPKALSKKGINLTQGVTVVGGDVSRKALSVKDAKGESQIRYDKLILATGGRPVIPQIPGADLKGVFTVQDLADAQNVAKALEDANSVIIVGAGFSGLEAAEQILALGKEVHLIVRSRLLRRLLEPSMSDELVKRLPSRLHVHIGKSPDRVLGTTCVAGLSLGDDKIDADMVLFMTGVRPETSLAESLGLKIGDLGGIVVNELMETSVPEVYAVGDCIESRDFLTGKPILLPVGSAAARAGRQAGMAAIGRDKVYPEVTLRFQYDHIFSTEIVTVGSSTTQASDYGLETLVETMYDPAEFTHVAIITDKQHRIIGGQVLSARMASPIGYQLLRRVEEGATLDAQPLTKFRHEAFRAALEEALGPINP